MERYIALLRGINVGGHHKLPMAELRTELEKLGFTQITTLLNSGNVIFSGAKTTLTALENTLSTHLEKTFGFPVPTLIRRAETLQQLVAEDPFAHIPLTASTRLYVSFLQEDVSVDLIFPWTSTDGSYQILRNQDRIILSVLDLAVTQTTKGMEILERSFGKQITTRNWNTLKRIGKKLER